ncbi:Predicted component of the ribosome quality control (RQC) complex, YloA/Tae2 family, contains fibronectin-binding (FbpA) and DUF814 domains [Amphibacillus marinus]|uniref:Rqc2 homolog RqcH n=1 Tax=Amphibacillus marinus TaxID=872970 RepID=A0A1H8I040_9BACI|nr:NFACT RNA binding domain-containing protein [Amphibacillus marinus]SEN61614.1 Predicted component of the ribosome quality control (RQC) complex, YloA/Tae2 family, contains fibronectin-binding (FbpA) and DUF814 domains [Amphibacillus marinus]
MTFDGLVTRAIATQLQEQLYSGRILKLYQPTQTELVLTIRAFGKNHSLLLSAHPSYARVHLTTDSYKNPTTPPMFCMLLRKHLVGSFIESVKQYENERIIELTVRGKNEIGDETSKKLIIEIMGKHSNVILVDYDKGHILDSLKHLSPNQNRLRTILPGQMYTYPQNQTKHNPFRYQDTSAMAPLFSEQELIETQDLVTTFMGISPLVANEICERSASHHMRAVLDSFDKVLEDVREMRLEPTIYAGKKEQFYILPLTTVGEPVERFTSISEMLDHFYSDKAERDRVKQQAGDLIRLLTNERDKNVRKIKKQEQTLQKAAKADRYQKKGELLTAHLHLVKQGDKSVTVVDYYDPDQAELTIDLDPQKSPSENAQSYFKTYQKLKTSKQKLTIEIEKANQEIAYLDQLIQQVEVARDEDIEEIREELREEGYLKTKTKDKKKPKKPTKPEPAQYWATDGTLILVGKNNKQNEYLTMRLADRRDIWLHTKDIPGSHVVIRSSQPSEDTLAEAAQLAALFSKASQSSSVPVDYTEIRHVKKPNGAKPGYVTYDSQKTLFVKPDQRYIKELVKKSKEMTS